MSAMNSFNSWQPRVEVEFCQQPPASHRKSTFFNFTLEVRCPGVNYMATEAKFLGFVTDFGELENQNGLQYRFLYKFDWNGRQYALEKYLYIWLVDSETNELIRYEGKKTSEEFNRVLLIHSHYCERCVSNTQACGNNTEKPKDPAPNATKTEWKFSMKFNQNCQTTSGNPTDKKKRKFRLLVSMSDSHMDRGVDVATSTAVEVHNNSKKAKDMVVDSLYPDFGYPGSNLVITGRHFDKDTVLYVGGQELPAERPPNCSTVLQVVLPNLGSSGPRSVILKKKDLMIGFPTPLKYYNRLDHNCPLPSDCSFCRSLWAISSMFPEVDAPSRAWHPYNPYRQTPSEWKLEPQDSTNRIPSWDPESNSGFFNHLCQEQTPGHQMGVPGFPAQNGNPEPGRGMYHYPSTMQPQPGHEGKRMRFSPPLRSYQHQHPFSGTLLPDSPPFSGSESPDSAPS